MGERRYNKLFVVVVEGKETEPQYFQILNMYSSNAKVLCLKPAHSSPLEVLDRMIRHLKQERLRDSDEAWIVVDKDQWTDQQLQKLYQWSKRNDKYGFALSNPNFRYWLLLHFEDAKKISSSRDCLDCLRKYISDYAKDIDLQLISREMIDSAIKRARLRNN